ncbi:MAG: patatin-like phospholipase family protein [Parvibaculales bacterium]
MTQYNLDILAGPTAYRHIQENGLQPSDITRIMGASGASKWLTIAGLDIVIFGDWLAESRHDISLFGTSVGAFKLAAAASSNSAEKLTQLADLYAAYDDSGLSGSMRDVITQSTRNMIHTVLNREISEQILNNPRFRYHCGTVRPLGWFAADSLAQQSMALTSALAKSPFSRTELSHLCERVIFQDPRSRESIVQGDAYPTTVLDLTPDNLIDAVMSSGSMPVYMHPVSHTVQEKRENLYDGGMLDYHPVPDVFWQPDHGLTLYPHFYSTVKLKWFDKFYPWRRAGARELDRVILLCPSRAFIDTLPDRRIPSRQDFRRYAKNPDIRAQKWTETVERSHELGYDFMQVVQSGDIAKRVKLIT